MRPGAAMVLTKKPRAAPRISLEELYGTTIIVTCLIISTFLRGHGALAYSRPPNKWEASAGSVKQNVSASVVLQFIPANVTHKLTHLAVDPRSNDVYVGAVNRIYQLDGESLNPVYQVITGPRLDSPKCHASNCDSSVQKFPTDNFNKLLVIAVSDDSVIACGSVSQGACDKYRLGNLSLHLDYIPKSVAANDPNSSTFAFVGPERYKVWKGNQALYVGTTFTEVGDYRNDVPALSTRNLHDLEYAEFSFSTHSLLRIDVKYRDHFLVNYVYGFNATDYIYFVTVQKKSHLPGQEEMGYISKISRSCISDGNYDSYTEISLECKDSNNVTYNLIQDAKLIYPGVNLAKSMNLPTGTPVLIGTFSPSKGHSSNPKLDSAICIFSVKDIEEKFNENIHMCFNGTMRYRNMGYVSGPINNGECPRKWAVGNIMNFCEEGLKISGSIPIRASSSLMSGTLITAIQGVSTASHTVAFLGTSTGTLKKVLIVSQYEAIVYQEVSVDPGYHILPDMPFTKNHSHLYIISVSKVSKVKLEDCSSYSNCTSCLGSRDPYCGWCSLEKRCTIQTECQKAAFSSPRWLSFGAGQQCIDFEMILPDRLPIHQMAMVQLTIRTLPRLPKGAKYQCVWGQAPPLDAEVIATGLRCQTLDFPNRPQILSEKDHVLVPLSVRSSETRKDFVSRNFAFYDCHRHTTCGTCVRSSWACNWCVYENICVSNTSLCRMTIISGENNPSQLLSHGASFCPRFWLGSKDLLAPNGARKKLVLFTENLPTLNTSHKGFQCVVSVEGATMVVDARVLRSVNSDFLDGLNRTSMERRTTHSIQKVVCDPTVYRYESNVGEFQAKLTLVWNIHHTIDSRSLTLYKCGVLGAYRGHQDCSLCVTRPIRYSCAWCGSACKYSPNCSATNTLPIMQPGLMEEEHNELSEAPKLCPTPRIDVIQPLAGPLEGGTLVMIEGSNLGLRKEDIIGRVYIGNIPCAVDEYHVSVKITCRTKAAPRKLWGSDSSNLQFPVRVTTPAGTTESTVKFTYTNVTISGVWPPRGPLSGGTILSINGDYLNVGTNAAVQLDGLPCKVNKTQSSSHRLVCLTSRANSLLLPGDEPENDIPERATKQRLPIKIRRMTIKIDGAVRSIISPFIYVPDPTILELKPLKSPWSGGRMLTVHGSYLNAIQAPRITVLFQDKILNSSSCYVINPSKMQCPSPTVSEQKVYSMLRKRRSSHKGNSQIQKKFPRSRENVKDSIVLDVGFIMDNVASVRNLKHHLLSSSKASLIYVADPYYKSFSNNIKLYKGDTLVIEGDDLTLASDEADVNVTIGREICNVTSLALTQLVCTPPSIEPDATDELGKPVEENIPLVVVRVGRLLRFQLGYLKYETLKPYAFPREAVGGIAAGGIFLVLVSMAVLVVYRRKSNQAEREYKRIQIQMDTLESNVRSECKQAFAELQTDMTDLTADLESSGIPTLDHRVYMMKVFFPGLDDHPILNDCKLLMNGCRPAMDNAMIQFEQLITNRCFLLTAINVLESQKGFNVRDKVNVASLLVVALTGRMEYLTEILRILLARLIEKSVSSKHPQLMLRRTESVVEKMLTNWLSLCMYNYLKDLAGPSLFLLYKAIKHQVEKGPIDAVTHDARYSLSEERLLREQITTSVVTLAVIGEDGEKAACRVLSCDTISQVKAKVLDALYRNTPFSLRPSIHDVDLEWRQGRNGHLILADEDMTTKIDSNGWKRLNILSHYGIADSALMALVHRSSPTYVNSTISSKFNTCSGYARTGSVSPICYLGDYDSSQQNQRCYHLVTPVDHDSPSKGGERNHKTVPEIFLTRLLSTKGTVQKFVNDFFRTILTASESLPPAIKWLFDFFDESALRYGITDPEVVFSWKSNSLPLRFWVNFIKNPDFILDVHKSTTVDSSLSVIAQTFMDACSMSEHRLGKDSPSSKLLFAKDMSQYKTMVRLFYQRIRDMHPVTDQDMAANLHQLSLYHIGKIETFSALHELFHSYIARYYTSIVQALEMDPECRSLHLSHKLDNIMCTLNGEPTSMC